MTPLYMLTATRLDSSDPTMPEVELKVESVGWINEAPVIDCLLAHIGRILKAGGSLQVMGHKTGLTQFLSKWAADNSVTIDSLAWAKLDGALEILFQLSDCTVEGPVHLSDFSEWRDRVFIGLHRTWMTTPIPSEPPVHL